MVFILLTVVVLCSTVIPCLYLVLRWANPRIVSYPWPERSKENKLVVLAGSYNPPTKGHLSMIEYLANIYQNVTLVVGFNPSKVYDVSPQVRAKMLQNMVSSLPNVRVVLVEGLIWRYAIKEGARVLVRGIRTWEKDGIDEQHLHYQNTIYPLLLGPLWWPIPTLFLEGKPEYNHISSTLVRSICQGASNEKELDAVREKLSELVPTCIVDDVANAYGGL